MSEYTRGPWEIFTIASPIGRSFRIFAPPIEDKVEAVDIAHIPRDWESEANARLIAAAPEMVEALILIDLFAWTAVKGDCYESSVELNRRIAICRAALARALGEA